MKKTEKDLTVEHSSFKNHYYSYIYSQKGCVKKYIKNDTLCIKNCKFLMIFLVKDNPGVSK